MGRSVGVGEVIYKHTLLGGGGWLWHPFMTVLYGVLPLFFVGGCAIIPSHHQVDIKFSDDSFCQAAPLASWERRLC